MSKAQKGDTVKVHYVGKLKNGEVFDSSYDREPLEFTIGGGQLIKGFDNAVEGMEEGEKKTVTIPADEAYGPYREDMIIEVGKENLPEGLEPQINQQLYMEDAQGQTLIVTVTEVLENSIKLDANHPLAGKDLVFDIELISIV